MIEAVQTGLPVSGAPVGATATRRQQAEVEFMTIFYKEMLKQVFKTPRLSGEDEEESGFSSALTAMNSDLLAEKMAEQMVKSALANRQWSGLGAPAVGQ
ncbi:MAG: hypothetical protein MUC35_04790 [Candidatus Margulisbacteria bacterium]|jgi:Rod binding domain-containing protein|nr:hypothetical protein [Candidatus Margulisiibacteriota bacterium]